jgi:hypothetical protein
VTNLVKDNENVYQDVIVKIRSKHSPWFERTTASLWLIVPSIFTKYNIPMPADLLMYSRASLLYDTLAARLWPRIDYFKEQTRLSGGNQRKVRRRFRRALRKRLREGITDADFLALNQLSTTGSTLLYRLRRLFAGPYDFAIPSFTIEKKVFIWLMILRFALRIGLFIAVAVGVAVGMHAAMGDPMPLENGVRQVVISRWFQIGVALLALIHVRLIWYRLRELTTYG